MKKNDITEIYTCTSIIMLNNTFLSNSGIKEEVTKEIRKYFDIDNAL